MPFLKKQEYFISVHSLLHPHFFPFNLTEIQSIWRTYYGNGKREGKAEMIHNLHRLGLPLEQIAIAAQLSPEQIEAILKSEL